MVYFDRTVIFNTIFHVYIRLDSQPNDSFFQLHHIVPIVNFRMQNE
jgi:hypothetical protein